MMTFFVKATMFASLSKGGSLQVREIYAGEDEESARPTGVTITATKLTRDSAWETEVQFAGQTFEKWQDAVRAWREREGGMIPVGEALVELGREAVQEVVEHVFTRGDVDLDVVPFARIDVREPPRQQRFAGRDDLHHRGMTIGEPLLDRTDQGRGLHRGNQMVEEALFGGFEGGARG